MPWAGPVSTLVSALLSGKFAGLMMSFSQTGMVTGTPITVSSVSGFAEMGGAALTVIVAVAVPSDSKSSVSTS